MTNWTDQQENFFSCITGSKSHVALSARAGTGKTTALVEAARRINKASPGLSVLAVAFNKSIAAELEERMPTGVDCSTLHSLGFRLCRKAKPELKFKINNNKIMHILGEQTNLDWEDRASVARIVQTLQLNCIPQDRWETMAGQFLEETGAEADWAPLAVAALESSVVVSESSGEIDFTDMIWLPWFWGLRPKAKYDLAMVDEAQDMNVLQRELVKKFISQLGRVCICGDPKQAIYGFAGATAESMDAFKELFKKEFIDCEISKTFRCPPEVVAAARVAGGPDGRLNNYESMLPEGSGEIDFWEDAEVEDFQEGDAIICRTNRPLMEMAIWFLSKRKGFRLAGKEFLRQLQSRMCKGLKATAPKAAARRNVSDWLQARIAYAEEIGRPQLADRHRDVADCCFVFLDLPEIQTVQDIKDKLKELETDQMGPMLTSIHKAKGLEWDRVFWLGHADHMQQMTRRKENEDPDSQEWNLRYVCATRAKRTLVYLNQVDLGSGEES